MNIKRFSFGLLLTLGLAFLAACNAVPVSGVGAVSDPTSAVPASTPAVVSTPEVGVGVAYPSVGQLPTETPAGSPASVSDVLQEPQSVTLVDNGKTVMLKVGDRFLLNLGMDVYQWSLDIPDQTVLSRVKNVMTIKGSQGLFEALKPGTTTLTADGNPLCANETPACKMPSRLFKITVIVQ